MYTNNNAANTCLTFQDNVVTPTPSFGHSDFHFDNTGGTFKLVSTRLSSNVGQIVETGTITLLQNVLKIKRLLC